MSGKESKREKDRERGERKLHKNKLKAFKNENDELLWKLLLLTGA